METAGTKHFDNAIRVTKEIAYDFLTVGNNLECGLSHNITYLINTGCRNWWDLLNTEIRNRFISQPESRLQDRFANYLIANIKYSLIPLYNDIVSEIEDRECQPYEPRNFKSVDYAELSTTENLLQSWLSAIVNNIKVFTPEVYAENKQLLRVSGELDAYGNEIIDDQLAPTEPGLDDEWNDDSYTPDMANSDFGPTEPGAEVKWNGAKLKWNGTSDSLYDLFAQLSLVSVKGNKPLLDNTIEELARFLADHVEGMPSVETIDRRIREFRSPVCTPPKRGRIELDITKSNL